MAKVDVDAVKGQLALSSVVEHYIGAPARTSGRWAWWLCPFHADKKRPNFGVTDDTGTFHCYGCNKHGDHFSFVMHYRQIDFMAAYDELATLAKVAPHDARPVAVRVRPQSRTDDAPPSPAWQAAGKRAWMYAQRQLWGDAGQAPQAHLGGKSPMGYLAWRGLSEDTISRWNLGYMPKTHYLSPGQLGLQRDKDVWVPQGFVLPGLVDGVLWYLKFRPACGEPKYWVWPGGAGMALLGADRFKGGRPLLLAEGEMDAYLAGQEAGDLVDVATLGGAAKGTREGEDNPLGRWLPFVCGYEVILNVYDNDSAGITNGQRFEALSARVKRLRLPHSRDLGEFVQAGGDLRAWLAGELRALGREVAQREQAPGYPVFLAFNPGPGLALPAGQWWELEDGRVEAVFNSPSELEATLWATKGLGLYKTSEVLETSEV